MTAVRLLLLAGLLAIPVAAQAGPVTYSGYLDDLGSLSPVGGTLVDFDALGPPDFTFRPDRNVALFEFSVVAPTAYAVTSRGYNDLYGNTPNTLGFDAYITIFQGTGPAALFLEEFFNPVAAGDFQDTTAVLAAGNYTLAISMWNNAARADGFCFASGTLCDGFTGLANPELGRELYFEVDLDDGSTPVPEPGTLALVLTGSAAIARRYRRRSGR